MSDGMPYADIVILALIAGFVILRLRSVLGQKIGHDPSEYPETKPADADSPVIQLGEKLQQQQQLEEDNSLVSSLPDEAVRSGLTAIKAVDDEFTLKRFVEGARGAFEMVFDAFVRDDRDTLKMLLSPELYDVFVGELNKRNAAETYTETTLVAVDTCEVVEVNFKKPVAQLRVRIVSEQVSVERDRKGDIVGGNPSGTEHVEDFWTFERDVSSRNPNWKIIDT